MRPSLGLICRMSPSGSGFKCFTMDDQMGGGCEGILCVVEILLCEGALLSIHIGDLCDPWESYLTFLSLSLSSLNGGSVTEITLGCYEECK